MDDQAVEEDPYSDDDLDALPDNAFHELEDNAVRNTQAPANTATTCLPAFKKLQRIDRTSHIGGAGRSSAAPEATFGQPQHGLQEPSSDYGEFDDEMLDGEIFDAAEQPDLVTAIRKGEKAGYSPGESTQREQWRQQRYARPQPRIAPSAHLQSSSKHPLQNGFVQPQPAGSHKIAGYTRETNVSPEDMTIIRPAQANASITALQSQIEKLLRERDNLQQAIQTANNNAFAKAGEIAIVRANASKIENEYQSRIRALQSLHTDEAAKQKIEIEKAKADLQKISTERDFLENDLAEGTKQIRHLQKAAKKEDRPSVSREGGKENAAGTPKRQKAGLGDGFDEDEIQPLSPSKLVLRSKTGTPKAGSKRKRKGGEESPSKQSLEFDRPIQAESSEQPNLLPEKLTTEHAPQPKIPQTQNFPFIQRFLSRRISHEKERTIEALAKFKLPSQPEKALSTILLDKLSPRSIQPNTENLPSAVALEVISIWSQCIQEQHHDPIHLLLDQVKYILMTYPVKTAPDLTNDLMSLLQETADIIIIPRCQKKPPRPDQALIASTECLEVICLMAIQLSMSQDEATRFWRTMRFDFIMMLLSFIHPINEIHLTIRILHTSILGSSFAMIIPPGDGKQDATEAKVIDNLSRLLVESPRTLQGEPLLSGVELAELRLSILGLIEEMSTNDYAALAICRHRLLLGRLVRLMNDSLANAYDYTTARSYLIGLVNTATRLLYYFMDNFPEEINMQQKLSVIPGGEKKFLIVLTRLAFSEGVFLEEGIEDDVVELAHRMLEERVSPEEAEGLVGVMSSAPATRAMTERTESRDEQDADNDDDEGG